MRLAVDNQALPHDFEDALLRCAHSLDHYLSGRNVLEYTQRINAETPPSLDDDAPPATRPPPFATSTPSPSAQNRVRQQEDIDQDPMTHDEV